jgi:hypothetical protein
LQQLFQRQHITFNDTTGKWRPTSEALASTNITYAPVNTCDVPALGSSFYYDKNADGSLADEKAVVPNPVVNHDLKGVIAPATNVQDTITARGMATPTY